MSPNILLIFVCLVLGLLLRRTPKFPPKTAQALNAFVIWISLPALILVQIPTLLQQSHFGVEMLIPVSMAWILFALSFFFFNFIGKRLGWSRPEIGSLILTAGLGNTSFVGFPLLESFFGAEGVRIGVLVDQPGTFLAVSTVGLLVASLYTPQVGRNFSLQQALKNVLSFPPFVALIASLLWAVSGTFHTGALVTVLERLGSTLVPLALVAVGFQLKVSPAIIRRQWKPLSVGLLFKLVLSPVFFLILYVGILGSQSFSTRVTILESAMAPMITAAVVAEEFGLNAEIANLMVGIGIPLSLLTVYLWNQLPLLQKLI